MNFLKAPWEKQNIESLIVVSKQIYINIKAKNTWNPFPKLVIDDELDLWSGRGGEKIYNPKKADVNGLCSWNLVDSSRFCFKFIYTRSIPRVENRSNWLAEYFVSSLPGYQSIIGNQTFPFQLTCDADLMSDFKNRPSWLWDWLQHN